jgi:hypothetical protein
MAKRERNPYVQHLLCVLKILDFSINQSKKPHVNNKTVLEELRKLAKSNK